MENPANAGPTGGRPGIVRGGAFDAANENEGPAPRNLFNDEDGRPVNRFPSHARRMTVRRKQGFMDGLYMDGIYMDGL